jgi:hypothetical protein
MNIKKYVHCQIRLYLNDDKLSKLSNYRNNASFIFDSTNEQICINNVLLELAC